MKFLQVAFLFISITAFSQSKVGTINIDYVVSKMAEYPMVQSNVESYGQELDGKLKDRVTAYETLLKNYREEIENLNDNQKVEKEKKILTAEAEINKFRQNAVKLLSLKRDELLRPLYKKIGTSLEKIAKEQSYTQVMQINDNIIYLDEKFDLTVTILNDLGITLTEEDKK